MFTCYYILSALVVCRFCLLYISIPVFIHFIHLTAIFYEHIILFFWETEHSSRTMCPNCLALLELSVLYSGECVLFNTRYIFNTDGYSLTWMLCYHLRLNGNYARSSSFIWSDIIRVRISALTSNWSFSPQLFLVPSVALTDNMF